MNRHILKPPSICQIPYRLRKQNWRLLHFWLFGKVLHRQMHRLLLCLDEKKSLWGRFIEGYLMFEAAHAQTQACDSLRWKSSKSPVPWLSAHVACWYACCVVYEHGCSFLAATTEQKSKVHVVLCVSVRTQYITPEMLKGKANSTRAVTWQPLNHYPSLRRVCERTKPKRLRHSKSHGSGSKRRKREFSEVGWRSWFDCSVCIFFWAVCFVWCYLEGVYLMVFWWFGRLRSFVVV